jgi:hypothetical protein
MNEKSSCPVLRGRDGGNIILLLDLLRGAIRSLADLNGATGMTSEELEEQTRSLDGATMVLS